MWKKKPKCDPRIVVTIFRSEVVDDVDYRSWKIAKCRPSESPIHEAERQTDGENARWLDRELRAALSAVRSMCRAYNLDVHTRFGANSDDLEAVQWDLVFTPEPAWRGSVSQLADYIHQYLVAHLLTEWFRMVDTNEAETWAGSRIEYARLIREEISNVPFVHKTFVL